jgi:hypothetical protein
VFFNNLTFCLILWIVLIRQLIMNGLPVDCHFRFALSCKRIL